MTIHSFHLAQVSPHRAIGALLRPPSAPGLRHIEILAGMQLGAPVISPHRMQVRRLAAFAEWADEAALEEFLAQNPFGRRFDRGWHVRLEFLRRWGAVRELAHLPEVAARGDLDEPVVAVTLARMRLPELPRFIHWVDPSNVRSETIPRRHWRSPPCARHARSRPSRSGTAPVR